MPKPFGAPMGLRSCSESLERATLRDRKGASYDQPEYANYQSRRGRKCPSN